MNQRIGLADGDNLAGEAMTLASIAYCPDIEDTLKKHAPGWSLVWQPDVAVNGNLAYVAYNEQADQYAVAIRGSIIDFSWGSFDNWFEQDFNVFIQCEWVYPQMDGVKISLGAYNGLNDLAALSRRDGCLLTRLVEVFRRIPGGPQSILVTGHSLGGNLATVFAPWLLYQLGQLGVKAPAHFPVMTFAAPTAGNVAFAAMYDATFPDSWRYYNTLDIIPKASDSVGSVGTFYKPSPQAGEIYVTYEGAKYTLQWAFDKVAQAIGFTESAYNSYYSHTNGGRGSVPLTPKATDCNPDSTEPPVEQWFWKAGCEHGHETYLSLLGAKQVKCETATPTP